MGICLALARFLVLGKLELELIDFFVAMAPREVQYRAQEKHARLRLHSHGTVTTKQFEFYF